MQIRPKLFRRWVESRLPRGERVVLTHRCVYVLPTGHGVLFAAVLVVLLIGSINYAIGLGFALTFLLGGVGLVSMLHTWRNLAGLELEGGRGEPVFAGQTAELHLKLGGRLARYAVELKAEGATPVVVDVPPGGGEAVLRLPAPRRGWRRAGRLEVVTRFPLGLFRAWSWAEPEVACLVYPLPEQADVPLPAGSGMGAGGRASSSGQEDFNGLRAYRPGDSPRHVAWKAVARGETLLSKEFAGEAGEVVWLDWHALALADAEARLSRLTRWVLEADRDSLDYGLRLPGKEIPPATGPAHRHDCLSALALYGLEARP